MREFGSIGEIAEADVERLRQVPEITAGAAEEIYRYFHRKKDAAAGAVQEQAGSDEE